MTRSAGTNNHAPIRVTRKMVDWADVQFCYEGASIVI